MFLSTDKDERGKNQTMQIFLRITAETQSTARDVYSFIPPSILQTLQESFGQTFKIMVCICVYCEMLYQNPIHQIENVHQSLFKNMILWLRCKRQKIKKEAKFTLFISLHFLIAWKQKDCFGCWKDVQNLEFTVLFINAKCCHVVNLKFTRWV